MVYFNTAVYGGKSMVNPVTCIAIFTSLKHLMVLLRCNFFQGFICTPLSQTLIAWRDMQLRFLKVKTLLNNAFNLLLLLTDVGVIVKFAQLEYRHAEPERGKTMFENVLSNYPKRTDIWSIYLDMTNRQGETEASRWADHKIIHHRKCWELVSVGKDFGNGVTDAQIVTKLYNRGLHVTNSLNI